jgi:enoyl-CoA hydratase/carnithine racemase
MAAEDEISVTKSGWVARVSFRRGEHNHVSGALLRNLVAAMTKLDEDRDCRAIVLAPAGKAFCAGAHLAPGKEMSSPEWLKDLYAQAAALFAVKTPIVAAVQGPAVGAGLGLALVADFRIAAPEARFVANFAKLGTHAGFAISYVLPRLIGQQRAATMLLTGRRIKADQALAWGLADEIVPLADLDARADALAGEIAENAPLAVAAMRATLRGALAERVRAQTEHELAQQLRLRETHDYAEGVRAVAERRPGRFTGA